jgi:DNA-binding NarL/FixJ family response regulator
MKDHPNPLVRVMIVEDDAEALARFSAALSADPRTSVAQTARSGREAIARLPATRPDVLLVDLGLPDIPGTDVIRHASRTQPECDIMVITVFGDERNVFASIEAGATGYILKDCPDAELVGHVVNLRAGGAPISPGIARLMLSRLRAAPVAEKPNGIATGVLTGREIDVLGLMARGYSYGEIAEKLSISPNTVASHIKNSYRKLAVRSGPAAVTRAAELGLLRPSGDPESRR